MGECSVGVRVRSGTTIVCVCRRSAANLSWVAVWRERVFSGTANEQPASLELDARVTYLLKLVCESELQNAHAPVVTAVIVVFYFYH